MTSTGSPSLIIRLVMDAAGYFKTQDSVVASQTKLIQSNERLGSSFAITAQQQVEGALKGEAALKSQITAYRELATSATASAAEQRKATQLATAAQLQLDRAQGLSIASTRGLSSASKTGERDLSKLARGGLAGAGVFQALGRSLAFASSGFIAVAAGATFLHSAISEALALASTQKQVDQQLKVSGRSWQQYGGQIDAVDTKLSAVSGFTRQELLQSFNYLYRVSNNVSTSLRLNAVAADVARGRHIALSSASIALAKALGGSVTALRRLGIVIPPGVKGMAALNYVAQKFTGQAAAGATAADRFHASLVNTEEVIGTALLPTFERLTSHLTVWLTTNEKSGRIQRDVNKAVTEAGHVFHTIETVLHTVDDVTGSLYNTLKLIVEIRLGFVVAKWIGGLNLLAGSWGKVAAEATIAGEAQARALGVNTVASGGVVSGAAGGAIVSSRVANATKAGLAERQFVVNSGGVASIVATGDQAAAATSKVAGLKAGLLGLNTIAISAIGIPIVLNIQQQIKSATGGLPLAAKLPIDILTNPVSAVKDFLNLGRYGPTGRPYPYQNYSTPFPTSTYGYGRSGVPQAFQAPGFALPGQAGAQQGPFGSARPHYQATGFQLTMTEQLAQAQAALTTGMKDDVKVAKQIIQRIKRILDSGNYTQKGLLAILQAEGAAMTTIQQAAQAAAAKAAAIKAAALARASTYAIPAALQLAQAKLDAYGGDTTAILHKIIAAAEKAIAAGGKNWKGLIAAYQVIGAARSQLAQDATTAVIPLKLQLAEAKAQALGRDDTAILKKMRAALYRALKKTHGNIQAQIDIWNQIYSINQQLGSQVQSLLGGFRTASTKILTAGLGLTADQRRRLRARLSQLGPDGTIPGTGTGAAGYIINPDTGRPIIVHTHVNIDGKRVADNTTRHQQRHRRRNPRQRRGPHAGAGG